MYRIGELSRLCRIPVRTLRYYDGEGLLCPDEIDRFTGYRYYSAARLADCNAITALKELGFSLDEIRRQMRAKTPAELADLIDAKEAELKETLAQTELRLRRLESVKRSITEGAEKMYNVVIRGADTLRVAARRKIYARKEDALAEIECMKKELPKNAVGRRKAVINYETEYREKDFDLAACVEIEGRRMAAGGYEDKTIAFESDAASLVCKTEELEDAYRFMTQWLEEESCQVIGAFYEIYHEDGTVELKVPVCRLSKGMVFVSDDINLPFVSDPEVLGKWEMIDIVPSKEQFLYGDEKCGHRAWLHELYFLEGGKGYWAVLGWTKGFLYTGGEQPQRTLKNKYTIEKRDGHTLLFLEMKHYKDGKGLGGGMPELWVYEKVDSKIYTSNDIRIRDNIDYPLVSDDTVVGSWKVRDFVLEAKDFDALKQNWDAENLFFLKVEFLPDGTCIHTTKKHESRLTWTKGLILNNSSETASAYEIKIIDGKEYLIVEWKTGDYQFGGGRIYWYVFVRE